MKFEPVRAIADVAEYPKRKRVAPRSAFKKGELPYIHPGTLARAEDNLKLARRIYRYLYDLGPRSSELARRHGYWNEIGINTIFRKFGRTKAVQGVLDQLAMKRIIRYHKHRAMFYSIYEPVNEDLLRMGDE